MRRDDVVEISRGVWTTSEILDLEDGVLQWHRDMEHRDAEPSAASDAVRDAIASAPVDLSDEQRVALHSILDNRFTALTGEAGTGKGIVLHVASTVWRSESRRTFAVALAGARAQALAADMGDDVTALTLDAFVRRVRSGQIELRDSDVIAVDEAGQIDTRRWAVFTDAVGARPTIVALGDHAQLSSISAGGLWPLLAQTGPRLTEVRRTRLGWERQAWAHLRRGEATQGLGLYARHGNVDISDTRASALERAVSAWDADGRDGLIVTDASNAERHRANLAAQQRRVDRADLGDSAVTARTPHGRVSFRAGDRVIFTTQHHDDTLDRRVENGTTGEIVAVDQAAHTVRVRTNEAQPREISLSLSLSPSPPRPQALRPGHNPAPLPVPVSLSDRPLLRRPRVQESGRHGAARLRGRRRMADQPRIAVCRRIALACGNANLRGQNHARSQRRRRCARRAGAPRRAEPGQGRGHVVAHASRPFPICPLGLRRRGGGGRRRREKRRAAAAQLSERRSFNFLPGHGPLWVPWSRIPDAPDSAHEVPRHGWR